MHTTTETAFADFWEASSLNDFNAAAFGNRVLAYEHGDRGVHPFDGAEAPLALRPVRDRFQRSLAARRSVRKFSERRLDHNQLTHILASVGSDQSGRPILPSAGGLASVHTFGVAANVSGPCEGIVFRYQASTHAVQRIIEAPPADELRRMFKLDCDGLPQLLLAFVADLGPALRKYGERGGRFVIQEAGHAAQNVGLRLAHDGLNGYILGGVLDTDVLCLLGLAHLNAAVVGAMACGW